MPTAPEPDWEEVLAQCEASAAQAEELLRSRSLLDPLALETGVALDLQTLRLPALPDHLTARARAVHQRQLRLQNELVTAMQSLAHEIQLSSDGGATQLPPLMIDRTI